MAKGATIQLIGEKKLLNMIKKLPTKAKDRKLWRTAARAAGNPIVKEVRELVDNEMFADSDEELMRSVKYRNFSNNVLGGLGGYVKFAHKSESRFFTNPAKAAVLVYNRKVKPLKKTFKNWILKATEKRGKEASALLSKRVERFLEREINKLL